jgi:hypothetical protein
VGDKYSKIGSPKIEDVSEEDAEQVRTNVRQNYQSAEQDITSNLQQGRAAGVRYIEREDRFENRSKLGQHLNSRINDARARAEEQRGFLEEVESSSLRRSLAWRIGYSAWRDAFKFRFAIGWALAAYIGAIAAIEILDVHWPVVWLPGFVRTSVVYAAFVGWVAGFIGLIVGRNHYAGVAEKEINEIRNAENTQETQNDSESIEAAPENSDWQSTLKIGGDATIDDIKEAYKEAIKHCHPDLVANMSESIRDAAQVRPPVSMPRTLKLARLMAFDVN